MASSAAMMVTVAIDFMVVSPNTPAYDVADDPLMHISQTMQRSNIPVAYLTPSQSIVTDTWSITPRTISDAPIKPPTTHTLTGATLHSRLLNIHSTNLYPEVTKIFFELDVLRERRFILLTSPDCHLHLTLRTASNEALPLNALLNISMLTTAFERCFDTLTTPQCIRHSVSARSNAPYNLRQKLLALSQSRTLTDLRHHLHSHADPSRRIFSIGPSASGRDSDINSSNITFSAYPSTLGPREIVAYTALISHIWDWCVRADIGADVAPLIENRMYDSAFDLVALMGVLGVREEVVKFFSPRLLGGDGDRNGDGHRRQWHGEQLKPQEISSVNTPSLELTKMLKQVQAKQISARSLKAVGRAIEEKLKKGGYGIDFMEWTRGQTFFEVSEKVSSELDEGEGALADFVAESVKRDEEGEAQLARECNELSVDNWALERYAADVLDEEETDSFETTPELESGGGSSRVGSPLTVWNFRALQEALPSISTGIPITDDWSRKQKAPVAGWNIDWESLGGPVQFR